MATILERVARLLNPAAPNATVALVIGCPKSTAKAYIKGRRRAPVAALERLQEELRERARQCWQVANCGGDLDTEIWRRKREPRRLLRGCCARKSASGRDAN